MASLVIQQSACSCTTAFDSVLAVQAQAELEEVQARLAAVSNSTGEEDFRRQLRELELDTVSRSNEAQQLRQQLASLQLDLKASSQAERQLGEQLATSQSETKTAQTALDNATSKM